MSVRVNKCGTDTDERTMLTSLLIDVVSDTPGFSYFIKDRPGNGFFKQLIIKFDMVPVDSRLTLDKQGWFFHISLPEVR